MITKIPVNMSVSRVTSTKENDYISIRIYDGANSNQLIDVKMALENFAKLVTGLSFVDGEGEFAVNPDRLGKDKYIKSLRVTISGGISTKEFSDEMVEWEICSAINDFGFEYGLYDFQNHKNYKYDDKIVHIFVSVWMYIDSTEEAKQLANEKFNSLQAYYNSVVLRGN